MGKRMMLGATAVLFLSTSACVQAPIGERSSESQATTLPVTVTTSTSEMPSTSLSELDRLRAEQKADAERAKAIMVAYQQALDNREGEVAASLISSESLDWYEEILLLAQTGDLEALEQAPAHQFYMAVLLRFDFDSEVHRMTGGADAFAALVYADRVLRLGERPRDYRVAIETAKTAWVFVGPERSIWGLHLEGGEWFVDAKYIGNLYTFGNDEAWAIEALSGFAETRQELLERMSFTPGVDLAEPPPTSPRELTA